MVSYFGYFFCIKWVQLRENNILDGAILLNCVFSEQIEYRDYETWCKQLLETDKALKFLEKMTLKIVHGIVFSSYLMYPENGKVWMTYNKKVQIYKLWCWVMNSREVKLEVILGNRDVWNILWGLETPKDFIKNMGISFLNYSFTLGLNCGSVLRNISFYDCSFQKHSSFFRYFDI